MPEWFRQNVLYCIVTLVERATGFTRIAKLTDRTTKSLNQHTCFLIAKEPSSFETITADNGTEFHQFSGIEQKTGVPFYVSRPYHFWERGTNENTNGLIRQYFPKGKSMAALTLRECNLIETILNSRPRKGLDTKRQTRHVMPSCYCCTSNLILGK